MMRMTPHSVVGNVVRSPLKFAVTTIFPAATVKFHTTRSQSADDTAGNKSHTESSTQTWPQIRRVGYGESAAQNDVSAPRPIDARAFGAFIPLASRPPLIHRLRRGTLRLNVPPRIGPPRIHPSADGQRPEMRGAGNGRARRPRKKRGNDEAEKFGIDLKNWVLTEAEKQYAEEKKEKKWLNRVYEPPSVVEKQETTELGVRQALGLTGPDEPAIISSTSGQEAQVLRLLRRAAGRVPGETWMPREETAKRLLAGEPVLFESESERNEVTAIVDATLKRRAERHGEQADTKTKNGVEFAPLNAAEKTQLLSTVVKGEYEKTQGQGLVAQVEAVLNRNASYADSTRHELLTKLKKLMPAAARPLQRVR